MDNGWAWDLFPALQVPGLSNETHALLRLMERRS